MHLCSMIDFVRSHNGKLQNYITFKSSMDYPLPVNARSLWNLLEMSVVLKSDKFPYFILDRCNTLWRFMVFFHRTVYPWEFFIMMSDSSTFQHFIWIFLYHVGFLSLDPTRHTVTLSANYTPILQFHQA